MVGRNAIELFDPALARRQAQLQHGGGAGTVSNPHWQGITLSREVEEKIAAALQAEAHKRRAREEERRKRDPTYRPDAIDLSTLNLKPFDKYVDYYARLQVSWGGSSHTCAIAHASPRRERRWLGTSARR